MSNLDEKHERDHSYQEDFQLDVLELLNAIFKEKVLVLSSTLFISILSIAYSALLPNYYLSESILLPVQSGNQPIKSSNYSALASLAGINLPQSNANNIDEIIAIIESREFVRYLINFEGVLPKIMATKGYDHGSNKIIFDSKIYDAISATWLETQPSYQDAHLAYRDLISIYQELDTGLVFISVEHKSPRFAKELLSLIIREANNLQRQKDIASSSKALDHLKTELSQTSLTEIKQSINQLIEAQLERQMMANINEEYALEVIEPPFIPEYKSKPSRFTIVIWSTIIGFVVSLLWIVLRHFVKDKGIFKS